MTYGMPYKGSKNFIAKEIINALPSSERLVDLFGGGGAITHCSAISGKWGEILYNEIDPLCCDLLRDSIAGKYSCDNFKPEWVSREDFLERKDSDGYIKLLWSFGNNGRNYLYGRKIEAEKKKLHELIVDKIPHEEAFGVRLNVSFSCDDIHGRRMELRKWVREEKVTRKIADLRHLECLGRLQHLERLGRLEIANNSYDQYVFRKGDIVYCDPPYFGTEGYNSAFDFQSFWKWCENAEFPLFVSEYTFPYDWKVIWQKKKRVNISAKGNVPDRIEKLFANKFAVELLEEQVTFNLQSTCNQLAI